MSQAKKDVGATAHDALAFARRSSHSQNVCALALARRTRRRFAEHTSRRVCLSSHAVARSRTGVHGVYAETEILVHRRKKVG